MMQPLDLETSLDYLQTLDLKMIFIFPTLDDDDDDDDDFSFSADFFFFYDPVPARCSF